MNSSNDLAIRPMTRSDDDLRLFCECFEANGFDFRKARARWQFVDNPASHLFIDLAVDESAQRLAAIYATLPGQFRVGDRVVAGVQSVNTLTDHRYRGQGLFKQLARSVFARARAGDVQLVYGFPNGNSAHGFFKRLEWTNLDPVPFIFRPLRPRYVLQRLPQLRALAPFVPNVPVVFPIHVPTPPGLEIREIDRFDERADALWLGFAGNDVVAIERDHTYLNWRLHKPEEPYRRWGLFAGDLLLAWIAFVTQDKHGGRVGYVLDLIFHTAHWTWALILLHNAVWAMAREGADIVLAWCFRHSPNFKAFVSNGFIPFPERLRPIELHFGARTLASPVPSVVARDRWYLSYCDSDTV